MIFGKRRKGVNEKKPDFEAVFATFSSSNKDSKIKTPTSGTVLDTYPTLDELKKSNKPIQIRWNFKEVEDFLSKEILFEYLWVNVDNLNKKTLTNANIPSEIIQKLI